MGDPCHKHDDLDWHDGNIPEDEFGGTHIEYYLWWLAARDLLSEELTHEPMVDKLKGGRVEPGEVLSFHGDCKLMSHMLAVDADAFTRRYYSDERNGYFSDYSRVFGLTDKTIYQKQFSWDDCEKLGAVIDAQFARWLETGDTRPASIWERLLRCMQGGERRA